MLCRSKILIVVMVEAEVEYVRRKWATEEPAIPLPMMQTVGDDDDESTVVAAMMMSGKSRWRFFMVCILYLRIFALID